jgi:hypothetical protein
VFGTFLGVVFAEDVEAAWVVESLLEGVEVGLNGKLFILMIISPLRLLLRWFPNLLLEECINRILIDLKIEKLMKVLLDFLRLF